MSKASAVDALQLRGMDTQRFVEKLGSIDKEILEEILMAVVVVIEY